MRRRFLTMAGTVHLVVEDGVARVTLDSPGKLNAISVRMWGELRAVVVRGAGGNFAAGADIEEFPSERHDETSGRRYHLDVIAPALDAVTRCPVPVVAAIEGVCVGGGLEIAVSCDIRIARSDARFGVPVSRIGFPLALTEMLPLLQLVGPGVAAELLMANRQGTRAARARRRRVRDRAGGPATRSPLGLAAGVAAQQVADPPAARPAHALHAARSRRKLCIFLVRRLQGRHRRVPGKAPTALHGTMSRTNALPRSVGPGGRAGRRRAPLHR
jgi:enoyl-CoA hydratase/carnithine racemase